MTTFRRLNDLRNRVVPGSLAAYAFASVCVTIAATARWIVGIFVDDVVPFATFFAATLIATLVGGIGPGLFAALVGGGVGWWAFMPTTEGSLPLNAAQQLSFAAYFITSLIVVWVANHYQRVLTQLKAEEKFRQLAVEELAHRLKNKVATIQAIVSMRLRDSPAARDEIVNCLTALRGTDDLILATQGAGALIGDILIAELQPYNPARFSLEGPKIMLPPKLALMMALILHELATNAAKYGALSACSGLVSVSWCASDPGLTLEWRESNGPLVKKPSRSGFGTRLLSRALEQFNGKVDVAFEPTGLVCRMHVLLTE